MDVIIVGAGPAGLAAAITIGKSGHRVRVLDQQPQFGSNKTSGIKIAPNFTRVLRNWGLGDALASVTHPIRRMNFNLVETGEAIGYMSWEDPVMRLTGGEMLAGAFEDVLRLMHDLALHHGAEIFYGHKVVAYESYATQDQPIVALEDGKKMKADLIINAAGTASLANISSGFETIDNWRPTGLSAYTTIIPGDKMQSDPELNELLHDHQDWPCWMGSNRFMLGYPIKQNTAYVLEIFWSDSHAEPWPLDAGIDEWIDFPPEAVDFDGCTPLMDKLLKLVTSLQRSRILTREKPLLDWANDVSQIVAIGDSVHSLPPFMISTHPLGIEDASALGVLFSHIPSPSMLPAILAGFQETRQPACETATATELEWFKMLTSPPGPERETRDAQIRAARDLDQEPTEEELRANWENLGMIFAHDAAEAAEDWWVKWGRLGVSYD